MSKKLYPPNIGGTIPAFCGTVLTVPFSMNKAVGKGEIGGFALKIKTVNGEYKGYSQVLDSTSGSQDLKIGYDVETKFEVNFDVSHITFDVGQYYKIQLAYIYDDLDHTVGYYSTVGVVKYTTEPEIYINNLEYGHINIHNYSYTGVYSQRHGDITEKMYSSRFQVFDREGVVLEDTGYILHNTNLDNLIYEQSDHFSLAADLPLDESFFIQFSVKTTNGLEISTKKYRIMQRRNISPEIEAELKATCNYENGSVNLSILDTKDAVISGKFLISRASDKNGWAWEEFKKFNLQSMVPGKWSLIDYTVEQGVSYRYSLQQYNDYDIYSDRIVSKDVYVDFEDSFLYDGERQLKIKFNPQVSSFSKTIMENKMDTIGSKYPFITRNGSVNYKEFPISGLISYQMDDNDLFFDKKNLNLTYYSTQLTGENIAAERKFKHEVWDWLTNGETKIFKSPAEGNFLIRLMNVSLSPENGLSRMLHSFSGSAVEVGEYTIANLAKEGVLIKDDDFILQTRWKTVSLYDLTIDYLEIRDLDSYDGEVYIQKVDSETGQIIYEQTNDFSQNVVFYQKNPVNKESLQFARVNNEDAYSVEFSDMVPGSRVQIEDEYIQIGASGTYIFKSETPISYIGVQGISSNQGLCTYSYLSSASNVFNHIQKVEIVDVPIRQFVGIGYQTEQHPLENQTEGSFYTSKNLLEVISDTKNTVLNTNFIMFEKRPSLDLYLDIDTKTEITEENISSFKVHEEMDCKTEEIPDLGMFTEDLYIYPIRRRRNDYRQEVLLGDGSKIIQPYLNEGYYVSIHSGISYGPGNEGFAPYTGWAYDGKSKQFFKMTPELYHIILNDESIDIKEKHKYLVSDTSSLEYVEINRGLIANLSYWKQVKEYSFEYDDNATYYSKEDYDNALAIYLDKRDNIICCSVIENEEGRVGFYYITDDGVQVFAYYPAGEPGEEIYFNLKTKRLDSLDRESLMIKYKDYILNLNKALTQYKEDNGIIS